MSARVVVPDPACPYRVRDQGHLCDGRYCEFIAIDIPESTQRAIVLAWLSRPEVALRLARWSDGASLLAALRQLAEEGK